MGRMKEVFILKEQHLEEHPEDKGKPDKFFFDLYLRQQKRNKLKNQKVNKS